MIVTQSAIVGVVVAGFALILCYVLADAGRYGFNRGVWFVVVLLLNLVGFIIYLIYSAAKTGDWKRATLPVAYIFEVIIVGVMVLIPLIYHRGPAQGAVDDLPGGASTSTSAPASARGGGSCSQSHPSGQRRRYDAGAHRHSQDHCPGQGRA